MLAERRVRRLSIRAADDALVRRAGFVIEDALRTASLPGDGAELLLLRRLRLPPFTAAASPQYVALRLEAACRAAIAVDGTLADDAALAAAPAVRFADHLSAHLALTRLLLAGAACQAWCWPLLVKGYRPALERGSTLRTLALSLANLPEAPVALPQWLAALVAHGDAACAAFVLALQGDDMARLQRACGGARRQAPLVEPARWQSLLDWSARRLGVDDVRHRWLLDMARVYGVDADRQGGSETAGGDEAPADVVAAKLTVGSTDADWRDEEGDDGHDRDRSEQTGIDAVFSTQAPGPAGPRADASAAPATPAPGSAAKAAAMASQSAPQRENLAPAARAAPPLTADLPATVKAVATARALVVQAPAAARTAIDAPSPVVTDSGTRLDIDAATAAGGLLFLVPVLTRLGVAGFLDEDTARSDLPKRIFSTLLRRLSIADDDPAWLLSGRPPAVGREVDRDAAHWLRLCRRHLRLQVGIGLYSLVCRPAGIAITATHVDVRQGINAVDLRIRRAGLDIDPGWVPWLGRVLRFHYGGDC
ncbi:hypothetical protein [Candidatus Accumulibacter sp. ACC003]|jgi:hypothetical protein|uniref:hypothetical protein n=1 Tax=Candidatus Accumulibacter sp. ACC003 TaxID=2823334 RepID=UPI0025C4D744|nr:hypothetical protein [Candidatus Accumulibacter sp. ACC003]